MKHKWTGKETWIPKIIKIMESTRDIKHKEIDLIALMAQELGKQKESMSHLDVEKGHIHGHGGK